MRCFHCGFENESDASFCEECGGALGGVSVKKPAESSPALSVAPRKPSGQAGILGLQAEAVARIPASPVAVPVPETMPLPSLTPLAAERKPLPKRKAGNPNRIEELAHWSVLIDGLQVSPSDFYARVQDAIEAWRMPEVRLATVDWREGGFFSAKREYLRVERKRLLFDICGAPFGRGFFVSWWLAARASGWLLPLLMLIPWVGLLFLPLLRPTTYYERDTTTMYRTAIDKAVKEVVDELIHTQGLRPLTELERKPILKDFF